MSEKSFCPTCEDYRETRLESRVESYIVRGHTFVLPAEVEVCAVCGQSISNEERDQEILDRVNQLYRQREGLLNPEQIKAIRERYALSQKSFAALLGMSEATVNRYERGKVQDGPHDALIRACEKPVFIRERLRQKGHLLSKWQVSKVEKALTSRDAGADDSSAVIDVSEWGSWLFQPREANLLTGLRRFDYHRYAEAVLFLCRELDEIVRTKLNKLLFYADFLNYKVSSVSLTGSAYRRIQYGPVPTAYGELLDQMEGEDLIRVEQKEFDNGYSGLVIAVGPKADELKRSFTNSERAVLDCVVAEFRLATAGLISERSHQETAYQDTADRQLISYETAPNLSLSLA